MLVLAIDLPCEQRFFFLILRGASPTEGQKKNLCSQGTIDPGNTSKIVTLSLNFGTISTDTRVSVLVITALLLVPYQSKL